MGHFSKNRDCPSSCGWCCSTGGPGRQYPVTDAAEEAEVEKKKSHPGLSILQTYLQLEAPTS